MGSLPWPASREQRAFRRASSDILGPGAPFLPDWIRRVRTGVATARYPWDCVMMGGTFAILYATALAGCDLIVGAGASLPIVLSGFTVVFLSVGLSAKLYGGLEAVAIARG